MKNIIFILLFFALNSACQHLAAQVQTGLDRIDSYKHLFQGKNLGIITNHTAYDSHGNHIVDIFLQMNSVKVKAIFGPEHGIRGAQAAGHIIENEIDPLNRIPIYSLYGKVRKPTSEMLKGIDILVFDIQNVGARFYTYIYTMSLAMEAAAENGVNFVILDRPNPINGHLIEGNILEAQYATFVGLYPIPVRHGMTIGELAKMFNDEGWLANQVKACLTVIPMTGWKRKMWYDETGLKWRAPSPNMPDLATATVYPGACLFEGTNVSEGRGTDKPFLQIGAPWFSINNFSAINDNINLPGVRFNPVSFVPKSLSGKAPNPKHKQVEVFGTSIEVTDRQSFRPYLSGIALVKYCYEINRELFKWHENHFNRLCGSNKIRKFIIEGKSLPEIKKWMDDDIQSFLKTRSKYLIY